MSKFKGIFTAAFLVAGLSTAPVLAQDDAAAVEPEIVEVKAPQFPRSAQRRNIEGHVVVRYNVTSEGEVADLEFVESVPNGILEGAVTRALRDWRYVTTAEGVVGVERQFDFKFAE